MIKSFFYKFPQNIAGVFRNNNWVWHLVAIALTYLLVQSRFDWWYFKSTRIPVLQDFAMTAAAVGFFIPIIIPLALYIIGKSKSDAQMQLAASASAQAGIIAIVLSSAYKAFTGRLQPELVAHPPLTADITGAFNFGFLQHGVFWGWPSSHTAVAFAMAVVLAIIYRQNKGLIYVLILYAFYIGLSVSVTIHWFSDFVAGAILGTVIAFVVAKSFSARNN